MIQLLTTLFWLAASFTVMDYTLGRGYHSTKKQYD
jgi:hypothetical protein